MPRIRFALPHIIAYYVDRDYIDISLSRIMPLAALCLFGLLTGVIFNHGLQHPYDKALHLGFYGLLTLSIHAFFCCRLRISAVAAVALGFAGEGVQMFIPGREASLMDGVANGIGVVIVVAAIALWRMETRKIDADTQVDETADFGELQPIRLSSSPSSRGVSDR
ncbi:VanZ family protein [Pannonibacter sp. Pt2-lr]|uniref:VanZ family protein n=1 Tax=Pannonibacter anstelovis TaxID=3121537 RepID=A0ABU7ZL94_9HYPH